MSIGELLNMYRDGELDIHPEFQRFYRWTDVQKSRLIESLLLGIPIPSIFVAQRKDGVWDVIDGLQRLSTIFEFVGVLKDDGGTVLPALKLVGTKYLPSLDGKVWESVDDPERGIGGTYQLIVKRSKIDVKIILRESDEQAKYDLFQRLNTGGSPLSDQELRNCLIITVNPDFYRWVNDLAQYPPFRECISLSERLIEEQYDLELVTRFIIFRTTPPPDLRRIGDIGEYLTNRVIDIATDTTFDREREESAFKATFSYLQRALADDSFRRFDLQKARFQGAFLLSAFEFIALGIGHHYEHYGELADPEKVREAARAAWADPDFVDHVGTGVRASLRIPAIIPLGRTRFAP